MAGPEVQSFFKDTTDPEPKVRKTLPQVSARRRSEAKAREVCREIVLARAGRRCQYRVLWPDVPCGWLPGRYGLEVDEIRGGSYRSQEHTDPDRCRATCAVHHELKTDQKTHALVERIEAL
jgi:hypothetical protein